MGKQDFALDMNSLIRFLSENPPFAHKAYHFTEHLKAVGHSTDKSVHLKVTKENNLNMKTM